MRWPCDCHMVVMWLSHGGHVTVTRWSCDWHMVVMWQSHGGHVIVTWCSCDSHEMVMSWLWCSYDYSVMSIDGHVMVTWLQCDSPDVFNLLIYIGFTIRSAIHLFSLALAHQSSNLEQTERIHYYHDFPTVWQPTTIHACTNFSTYIRMYVHAQNIPLLQWPYPLGGVLGLSCTMAVDETEEWKAGRN